MSAIQNPWLTIPLLDYEAHMALPTVAQSQLLADIFASKLLEYQPDSVVVLGCAGGNGFDRIDPKVTRRLVGIDINPSFVAETRARYQLQMPGLQLFVADIETDEPSFVPVSFVYAALVLEYVEIRRVLPRLRSMLAIGGTLVTVIQLPSAAPSITPTSFASLQWLSSLIRLTSADELKTLAQAADFRLVQQQNTKAPDGKCFAILTFQRN